MNFRHRAAAAAAVTAGNGAREDCWSEGATEALVEAWGDRFLHLSRGNLRQNDWKDVAESVNVRRDAVGKIRKTSGQCKNRIDTLKKKYKLEKSKQGKSLWPFFSRLDHLIGVSVEKPSVSVKVKQRNPNSSPVMPSWGSSKVRTNFPEISFSPLDESGVGCSDFNGFDDMNRMDEYEKIQPYGSMENFKRQNPFLMGNVDGNGDDEEFRELARVILKIGEIYERVERSKMQQAMELEKQRMIFEKDLEIQRMTVFMEAQLELERMKRLKYDSDSGKS